MNKKDELLEAHKALIKELDKFMKSNNFDKDVDAYERLKYAVNNKMNDGKVMKSSFKTMISSIRNLADKVPAELINKFEHELKDAAILYNIKFDSSERAKQVVSIRDDLEFLFEGRHVWSNQFIEEDNLNQRPLYNDQLKCYRDNTGDEDYYLVWGCLALATYLYGNIVLEGELLTDKPIGNNELAPVLKLFSLSCLSSDDFNYLSEATKKMLSMNRKASEIRFDFNNRNIVQRVGEVTIRGFKAECLHPFFRESIISSWNFSLDKEFEYLDLIINCNFLKLSHRNKYLSFRLKLKND